MSAHPTSEQYRISHGDYEAVIMQRGATLRSLRLAGRELLWTFEADQEPRDYQGVQLAPWPNRIADGSYIFDGQTHQLPINEPDRNTALHGLAFDKLWELVDHDESSVTLQVVIEPEPGWPFTLAVQIRHGLSAEGLTVDVTAANQGSDGLPFGYGVHPYFAFPLDELTLGLPFATELKVDPDRLLPIELIDVPGEHNYQAPRPLGEVVFDTAFTDPLTPRWEVTLTSSSHTVFVWGDSTTPWVQVFTTPDRDAIAVEPMTCGPDAFNQGPTHEGRIVLAPGESTTCRWGVRAV